MKILPGKCGSVTVTVTSVSAEKLTYPGSHLSRLEVLVVPVQKFQLHSELTGALSDKFT